jgi:serine/threonine-protein kinase HipA
MACGDYGRIASAQNLLTQAGRFLLNPEEAQNIINTMVETVKSSWHKTLRSVGVSEQECAMLENSFVYPGFTAEDK